VSTRTICDGCGRELAGPEDNLRFTPWIVKDISEGVFGELEVKSTRGDMCRDCAVRAVNAVVAKEIRAVNAQKRRKK
jgi:hypothetical protein